MDFEQMLAAISALGECSLKMRKPGDWYVSQSGVEISDGHTLSSEYGNGKTPVSAVENHWQKLSALPVGKRIVIGAFSDKRRAVRWNGFMWADYAESAQ